MSLDRPSRPMPGGRLLLITAAAFLVGFVIVFGAIVPAEFGKDPTGLGKLGGLLRLWAPPENIVSDQGAAPRAREYATGFRTDVIEIPLSGFLGGASNSELEYKVRMKKDATLIYDWEVVGAKRPEDFRFDFHGHTTPAPGQPIDVATYRQGSGLKRSGAVTAPFDGIQGWQFSNSGDDGVVVRLRLAGFYELIPSGQPGNEAGIIANVPAAQARPGLARGSAG